jgi:hypothetical protein
MFEQRLVAFAWLHEKGCPRGLVTADLVNLIQVRLGCGRKTDFLFRGVMQRRLLLRPESVTTYESSS